MNLSPDAVRQEVERVYRAESRVILASLIRLLGDFDVAEEASQEAFACALEKWPAEGIPRNPRAWLISVGRFRGLDVVRRASRIDSGLDLHTLSAPGEESFDAVLDAVPDDDLRLIFTCCHPALSLDARVALTLREVCGLSTEEISRAFLSNPVTIAQRIVRAKTKIRQAGIRFEVPDNSELPERLDSVLQVIYLVFNEGYSASFGDSLTRSDLSAEAIRLGELISDLTKDSEAFGLTALMLLQESRRHARSSVNGDIVILEYQDRSLWDGQMIRRGREYLSRAYELGDIGIYTLQAAIAEVHAGAASSEATDWTRIVSLYDLLLSVNPSPVIELNRGVAVAMAQGFEEGLAILDAILAAGSLQDYAPLHSARADFFRRLGRFSEAAECYRRAIDLTRQEPEQRFLTGRLEACTSVCVEDFEN